MNEMNYNIHQVAENTWAMQEGTMVSSYLVIGSETALLIDAGGMLPEMRERVEELTGLPVTVTLTHGHGDHIHPPDGVCGGVRGDKHKPCLPAVDLRQNGRFTQFYFTRLAG